jgi:hypothetical protein
MVDDTRPAQLSISRVTGHVPYQDSKFPITAVVSMDRRNTQLELALH